MGMFDTVIANCPKCGEEVKFQSKAGVCQLQKYHILNVPIVIAEDLSNESVNCRCGHKITIIYPYKPVRVSMQLKEYSQRTREFD